MARGYRYRHTSDAYSQGWQGGVPTDIYSPGVNIPTDFSPVSNTSAQPIAGMGSPQPFGTTPYGGNNLQPVVQPVFYNGNTTVAPLPGSGSNSGAPITVGAPKQQTPTVYASPNTTTGNTKPTSAAPQNPVSTNPQQIVQPATVNPLSVLFGSAGGNNSGTLTPGSAAYNAAIAQQTANQQALNPLAYAPTIESVFGANPYETNVTSQNPITGDYTNYNPQFFATPTAAAIAAGLVGGTVVSSNAITSAQGSPFAQSQPNQEISVNGQYLNAGQIIGLYGHGYSQATINEILNNQINGV